MSRADDHALPGTIVSPFHHKDVSSGKARMSPYRKDTTHWRWAHRRPRPCEIGVAAYPSKTKMVLEVPFGKARGHAEGITRLNKKADAERPKVLVVYDSPTKKRMKGATGVQADIFKM